MSQRNIRTEIRDAASVAAQACKFTNELLSTVESGDSLESQIRIFPKSEYPMWASTLEMLLCNKPELASLTNRQLAVLIEDETDGDSEFDHTIMSKKLGAFQRHYAGDILRMHGYATDTLVKGTDIKRIVKNNIRTESLKDDGVVFFADGLSINGRSYRYKQRESTPTGNPWTDFTIRMYGQDIKLQAVLSLRGIGIGEFLDRDKAARAIADPDQAARRQKLNREPQQSRRLTKIISADSPNKNGVEALAKFKAMAASNSRFE